MIPIHRSKKTRLFAWFTALLEDKKLLKKNLGRLFYLRRPALFSLQSLWSKYSFKMGLQSRSSPFESSGPPHECARELLEDLPQTDRLHHFVEDLTVSVYVGNSLQNSVEHSLQPPTIQCEVRNHRRMRGGICKFLFTRKFKELLSCCSDGQIIQK